MVDAALALQARGHRVRLYATHRDPAHSFPATRDGRLDVRLRGGRIPMQLAGRLRLPLAVARMLTLDAVVCDTVAQAVPLRRRLTSAPFVFYGHYPDMLLTPPRAGWYRGYRWPLDRWEATGLESADRLLVNSAFTAAEFQRCFPRLRCRLEVLHPAVDLARFAPAGPPPSACHTLAVVSRLIDGKNIALAIDAPAALRARLTGAAFAPLRLVIAGGSDARLRDCRDTVAALPAHAAALGLAAQVEIRLSPDDAALETLLASARALIDTPLRSTSATCRSRPWPPAARWSPSPPAARPRRWSTASPASSVRPPPTPSPTRCAR
jgi:alpha-1,3/alpha-1,6-mannosyltransferase